MIHPLPSGDSPQRLDHNLPKPVSPVRPPQSLGQRSIRHPGGDEHEDHAAEVRGGKPVQRRRRLRQGLEQSPGSGSILSEKKNHLRRIRLSVQIVS